MDRLLTLAPRSQLDIPVLRAERYGTRRGEADPAPPASLSLVQWTTGAGLRRIDDLVEFTRRFHSRAHEVAEPVSVVAVGALS